MAAPARLRAAKATSVRREVIDVQPLGQTVALDGSAQHILSSPCVRVVGHAATAQDQSQSSRRPRQGRTRVCCRGRVDEVRTGRPAPRRYKARWVATLRTGRTRAAVQPVRLAAACVAAGAREWRVRQFGCDDRRRIFMLASRRRWKLTAPSRSRSPSIRSARPASERRGGGKRTPGLLADAKSEDDDGRQPSAADRFQVDTGEARGREADAVAEQHRQYIYPYLVDERPHQARGQCLAHWSDRLNAKDSSTRQRLRMLRWPLVIAGRAILYSV